MTGTCARCGQTRELRARSLDGTCWMAAKKDGTLDRYPRTRQPTQARVEDYRFLRATGETNPEAIARRLGLSPGGLRMAVWRARQHAPA